MGALVDSLREREIDHQRVVMLGLDAAGKSTILRSINMGSTSNMKPTIGFNVDEVSIPKSRITLLVWDVAGQDNMRALWKQYLRNVSALIFVIDSADTDRIPEAKNCLQKIILDPELMGVPIVVVANKQDIVGSYTASDLESLMSISIIPTARNPCYVIPAIATHGIGVKEVFEKVASLVRASMKNKVLDPQKVQPQKLTPRGNTFAYRVREYCHNFVQRIGPVNDT